MKIAKKLILKSGITTTVFLVMFLTAPMEALGQDPTVVDATHYTVEFENDQVRVLRISSGTSIDAQAAHLWTLKDGKVIGFQQYVDTKQLADAMTK